MLDLLGKDVYYCVASEYNNGDGTYDYVIRKKKATITCVQREIDINTGEITTTYRCNNRDTMWCHEEKGELVDNMCCVGQRKRRYCFNPTSLIGEAELLKQEVLKARKCARNVHIAD